ncbi:hypothetical protein T439DRAFT_382191, partial [Meredithblackwellia eburnea MCA 4105]
MSSPPPNAPRGPANSNLLRHQPKHRLKGIHPRPVSQRGDTRPSNDSVESSSELELDSPTGAPSRALTRRSTLSATAPKFFPHDRQSAHLPPAMVDRTGNTSLYRDPNLLKPARDWDMVMITGGASPKSSLETKLSIWFSPSEWTYSMGEPNVSRRNAKPGEENTLRFTVTERMSPPVWKTPDEREIKSFARYLGESPIVLRDFIKSETIKALHKWWDWCPDLRRPRERGEDSFLATWGPVAVRAKQHQIDLDLVQHFVIAKMQDELEQFCVERVRDRRAKVEGADGGFASATQEDLQEFRLTHHVPPELTFEECQTYQLHIAALEAEFNRLTMDIKKPLAPWLDNGLEKQRLVEKLTKQGK